METEALQKTIESWNLEVQFSTEGSAYLNINVLPQNLIPLMNKLKDTPETAFDYLFCMSGVDWNPDLEVVYHLESTSHRHIVVVRTRTSNRENPVIDTVSRIWATAEFHECEIFDFFGIRFEGHPHLKRLFLTEDWEGYPLRKDYVDEVNIVSK